MEDDWGIPHDLGLRKSPNFDRATIFDQYQ